MGRRTAEGWLATGWCLVVAGVASAQAVVTSPTPVTQFASPNPALTAVEKAIAAEADATVKAFNAGDPAALGNMFIEDAELVDENGDVTETRAEITGLFKRFFERFPQAVLDMEVTDARAIGDKLVVEEGVRRITADQGGAAAQMRYAAVRTKEGDRWPIASYREFSDDPLPTPSEMLAPLDWLVGEWVDQSPEGTTQISYQWSEDGNFLIGDYNLSVGGLANSRSTQRIGWDPVEGKLRSWTFDSDGGFSEGEWMAADDGWLVKSEATMPDGTTGSATISIRPSDQDHFMVKSADRIIAGAKEPDFELVIARKPPAPAAAPAAPGK
ncbi:MAG: SgcJ/EcaC family oxidoreductase [Pirellulales bacterium]